MIDMGNDILNITQANNKDAKIYLGTSGLVLPVPNKSFYPEAFKTASRLHYYGHLYNSIEINSSFYKMPRAITVARWAEETGKDFKFTFKLLRDITHTKGLIFDPYQLEHFMLAISAVGQKKGCLLIQLPPSQNISAFSQFQRLIDLIREYDTVDWNLAIEFRHRSWYTTEVKDWMNDKELALVFHDHRSQSSPLWDLEANFSYLRFHGPTGDFRGSYDEAILTEYASYVQEWLAQEKDVYIYFNNTMGAATENLLTLRNLLT